MSKEPKRNVYVGHRYVPKIMGEWDKTETYEGLSIVTNEGTSYTSKKRVPKGIDILNEEYWVVTGNYNAQIEEYRKDVRNMQEDVNKKADKEYVNNQLENITADYNVKIEHLEDNINDELIDIKDITNCLIENSTYERIEHYNYYHHEYETSVYIVKIPYINSKGEKVILKRDIMDDNKKNVLEYARENDTTLAINAGMFGTDRELLDYTTILNGKIITGNNRTPSETRYHLGIKQDGSLVSYPTIGTKIETMLNDGVVNSTVGFVPLYENGNPRHDIFNKGEHFEEKHPRQIIAQDNDLNYYIITTGGRGVDGLGTTNEESYQLVLENVSNLRFAYSLDGGGSNTTVVRNSMIHPSYESEKAVTGNVLRDRPDVLFIKKEKENNVEMNNEIKSFSNDIGILNDNINFIKGVQYGIWDPLLGSEAEYSHDEITYSKKEGSYIRIGNLVVCFYHIIVSDKGDLSDNFVVMRNLPGASNFDGVVTSNISRFKGLARNDFYSPFLEQGNSGSANLKITINNDDKIQIPESLKYNALKNEFEMIGTHIFTIDGF